VKIRFIIYGIFSCFALFAKGQSVSSVRTIVPQQHFWLTYTGTHSLSAKWGLYTEYQFRRADLGVNWQQSLARIGVEYKWNDQLSSTIGYGHIITYPYGDFPVAHFNTEHRAWQQFVVSTKFSKVALQHRYRLEQRWVEKWKKGDEDDWTRDGFSYSNRIRYRLLATIPLNRAVMEKGTVFAALSDELFVQFGENIRFNIFDQNRIVAAVGYQFSPRGNVQLGYLNQFVLKSNGVNMENNHTLTVGLICNGSFSKNRS